MNHSFLDFRSGVTHINAYKAFKQLPLGSEVIPFLQISSDTSDLSNRPWSLLSQPSNFDTQVDPTDMTEMAVFNIASQTETKINRTQFFAQTYSILPQKALGQIYLGHCHVYLAFFSRPWTCTSLDWFLFVSSTLTLRMLFLKVSTKDKFFLK